MARECVKTKLLTEGEYRVIQIKTYIDIDRKVANKSLGILYEALVELIIGKG